MPFKIEHKSSVTPSLTATSSVTTSARIPWGANAGGMMFVSAVAGGATTITWYAAQDAESTPVPVVDAGANVTTAVTASKAYYVPDSLFSAPFVMAVTNAGTVSFAMAVKG
jgi:hypothetical protein